jgi:hypothetical protein
MRKMRSTPESHQHVGVDLPPRSGSHHDDLADARHLGRHGVHDHAAGVAGLAAGDVDADPRQGGHLLPQHDVRLLGGDPGLLFLFLVEAGHPLHGQHEGFHVGLVNLAECRLNLGGADLQLRHGCGLQVIEAPGQLQHGLIAPLTHVGDDGEHGLLHLVAGLFAAGKDGAELLGKVVVAYVEKKHGAPL